MRIVVALLTAAGMAVIPVIALLFGQDAPEGRVDAAIEFGLTAAALIAGALHVYLAPERRERVAIVLVLATALNGIAFFGVYILLLAGGSCDVGDTGHVPVISWAGAIVIYLALSTWLLQRPLRPLSGVPLALLAGGVWLVVSAVAITGSTGVCLD
jgi:hypothetical protein